MAPKNRLQRLTQEQEETKQLLTTLLVDSVGHLSGLFESVIEKHHNGLADYSVVDRTDLALAVSLVVDYSKTNNPQIKRLTKATLDLLEILSRESMSSEVGRSIIKLSAIYGATIPSVVDSKEVTTFQELSDLHKELL